MKQNVNNYTKTIKATILSKCSTVNNVTENSVRVNGNHNNVIDQK
jgi:translation initiation factor 1 (eIF-1/SUI1)